MFTASELFDLAGPGARPTESVFTGMLSDKGGKGQLSRYFPLACRPGVAAQTAFADIKEKVALLERKKYFLSHSAGRFFDRRNEPLNRGFLWNELQMKSIRDEEEILEAALLFEEDTILFFEFISPFITNPEASSMLERIRAEESNHKRVLEEKISEIRAY